MIASVVDVDTLLKVVGAAFAAGVGLTASFSLGVLGATRFVDMRRDGRVLEAGCYALLGAIGIVVAVVGAVFGVVVMTTK